MIKDLLTIVIPCKNEMELIDLTLSLISKQEDISGTRVIIADSSDDSTRDIILSGGHDNLNITIIDGGYPSVARNNGAMLSTTPYILFLDADIFLIDNTTIKECMDIIKKQSLELLTCKFRCEGRYSFVFPIFEFFRDITIWSAPCAIGGFMLFDISEFNKVGGFVNEDKFAEDFHLSMKISPDKFHVSKHKIYTTDRRFKKKGLLYMMKMSFLSYINKSNPEFFKNDHNYWL